MPNQYDLPIYQNPASVEDVNKYNKLPFYLAMMQVKYAEFYSVFNELFGKINWQPNMGSTMKAVQAVNTPKGRQMFYPNSITSLPNKDVIETLERTEQCNIKMHDFESKLFYFLPLFQDFRENQIDFVNEDMNRQMKFANNDFVQTVMWAKSPYIFIAGNKNVDDGKELIPCPSVAAGTDITAATNPKTAAWLVDQIAKIGAPGLRLSTIDRIVMIMRDDLGAPFFEGTVNTPKDNEQIKGKFVFVGSGELYDMFKWDPNLADFRSITWNIYQDGFAGTPFNHLTYKFVKYPWRCDAAGTFPVPEITDNATGDTVINPDYANAKYEFAWILGADPYKTIKIGPPPRAFAGKSMTVDQFNGMNWNGEIQLTRNVPVVYTQPDGSITYDTNKYGRYLQLIAAQTMGCLATRSRNAIPILFQRARPGAQDK